MADGDAPHKTSLAFLLEMASPEADFRGDVLSGLAGAPKTIPPKYFYDETGASLFEQICLTPEYYVTRAESELLQRIAGDVADLAGRGASVFEPGSGAAEKARLLLDRMDDPAEFILFDISRAQLEAAGAEIARRYPSMRVGAVAGDFSAGVPRADDIFSGQGRRICFFPGGTLGNFDPAEQRSLLKRFASVLRPGDAILLGVDAIKDAARLDAAYNDAQGLTAAFNLNLLARMQRDLDARLEPAAFAHAAFYNPDLARIEMHIRARRATRIEIDGDVFPFAPGEAVHTENSWKFDQARLSRLAEDVGLRLEQCWRADGGDFLAAWIEVPAA